MNNYTDSNVYKIDRLSLTDAQEKALGNYNQQEKKLLEKIEIEIESEKNKPKTSYQLNRYTHAVEFHQSRLDALQKKYETDLLEITQKLEKAKQDYETELENINKPKKSKLLIDSETKLQNLRSEKSKFFSHFIVSCKSPDTDWSPNEEKELKQLQEKKSIFQPKIELASLTSLPITPSPTPPPPPPLAPLSLPPSNQPIAQKTELTYQEILNPTSETLREYSEDELIRLQTLRELTMTEEDLMNARKGIFKSPVKESQPIIPIKKKQIKTVQKKRVDEEGYKLPDL